MRKSRFSDEQVVAILREADRDPIAAVANLRAPPRRATAPQEPIEGSNRGGRLKLSMVRRNRAGQSAMEIRIGK